MNETELYSNLRSLQRAQVNLTETYVAAKKDLDAQIGEAQRKLELSKASLDLEKIAIAETVLDVEGAVDRNNGCLQAAMDAIASGSDTLKTERIGVKDYAQFRGQRCDCSYGMGPKHGWIVFSVGLQRSARERDLTDDERNAALYYLLNLEAIQAAAKTQAA